MLTRADFSTDLEWLECCACRRTWPVRSELTPDSLRRGVRSRITWGDWYIQKFGRPITEAAAQYREMIAARAA